jgi:hypothetical protein
MTLSLRQWIILGALVIGFGIAALVARGDGGGRPAIDTAQWCTGAEGLAGTGRIFTGEADTATGADIEAAKQAIFAVEVIAPYDLRSGLARLADFSIVIDQALTDSGWPAAYEAARAQVDEAKVDQAIADLENEMRLCGLAL